MEWLLVLWISVGLLCAILAPSRGRSGVEWLVLGILFSPIALTALLALAKGNPEPDQNARSIPPVRTMDDVIQELLARRTRWQKPCPACQEYEDKEARQCRHCGHNLAADTAASQS
jgi:hypothetical protein